MAATSLSILTTVFVLNVYHCASTTTTTTAHQTEMSSTLRHFVLHHLARLVRCRLVTDSCQSSPPAARTPPPPKSASFSRIPEVAAACRKVVPDSQSSCSRLAKPTSGFKYPASTTCTGTDASSAIVVERHFDLTTDYIPLTSDHDVIHVDSNVAVNGPTRQHDVRMLEAIEEIVCHLRALVNKQDNVERREDIINEWRQVALVIDQLLFWIFLFVTVFYSTVLLVIIPLIRER